MIRVAPILALPAFALLAGCYGVTTSAYVPTYAPAPVTTYEPLPEPAEPVNDYASVASFSEFDPEYIYAATYDGEHEIARFDHASANQRYLRTRVGWTGLEAAGTIVIDVDARHLYLIEPNGEAIRYGIAVGKDGFGWTGTTKLARKATWPRWNPPAAMIERKPELEEFRNGMDGGPDNPIGARALYLHKDGRDTLYRIHGTNAPWSIGSAASSGCFRMINQDVIDLYERVGTGGKVVVRPHVTQVAGL